MRSSWAIGLGYTAMQIDAGSILATRSEPAMKSRKARLVSGLALALPMLAGAHGGDHADPVEYRHAGFYMVGWHFQPMADMVKGEKPMNAKAFARHATAVAHIAPLLAEGFADGPHKGKTDARPEIWKNYADFSKKMQAFETESARLAQVAQAGDAAQVKDQFMKTAQSCKACHDDYRKD